MRYFVQFSYQGKSYHGWQKQPNAISVQEVLENAFSLLLRETVSLVGAGRTDAGVHAREMFAHFDTDAHFSNMELIHRLNAFLPEDIAVIGIFLVGADAHARFDASERTYEYWVVQNKDPFLVDAAYYVKYPLNIEQMNEAAAILVAHKDFECFSKSNTDVKTYLCDLRKAQWENEGGRLIFTISADRFLRNMVRAIVGTLIDVGQGKSTLADIRSILASKDRSEAGVSVPAKGLYLTAIKYPKNIIDYNG
ncbi:tRNA pseudouridine(38-40) synthase TruA [Arenibacter sp. F20364]|uniref:tRNA pseudouridine(38-40) synthase TruA n=1 Tax=Arenibacter sp. F20364 TaxID=2926415 RepID=UPI001FF15CC7|nr:tRNA pseudouridine(38-40) synthase TruA [Arenibacter sp. F20364]MCK0188370.1 tRNA pseudouridine(38-40) synthase TruA [Arenibacter sp. F20364]